METRMSDADELSCAAAVLMEGVRIERADGMWIARYWHKDELIGTGYGSPVTAIVQALSEASQVLRRDE
jgi:hypothetical protein